MTRYMAIDLGDRRTGLAVADAVSAIVTPAGTLEIPRDRRDGRDLLDAIVSAADQHLGPRDQLVIGHPINMDGTPGPRAKLIEAFADRLRAETGRVVHLQDERLTSADADWAMAGSGMTHGQKKRRRDQLAAAAILRDFLDRPL